MVITVSYDFGWPLGIIGLNISYYMVSNTMHCNLLDSMHRMWVDQVVVWVLVVRNGWSGGGGVALLECYVCAVLTLVCVCV